MIIEENSKRYQFAYVSLLFRTDITEKIEILRDIRISKNIFFNSQLITDIDSKLASSCNLLVDQT